MQGNVGRRGERLAKQDYLRGGYTVLACNFRTRHGEIDIIAQKEDVLVFAEVKTRGAGAIAAPREWVTKQKQQRLILAAQEYIGLHYKTEPFVRFDVVEVILAPPQKVQLRRIENAFML